MRIAAPAQRQSETVRRLHELRVKAACRVLKAEGDPEEIRNDGIRVFRAFEKVRKRANDTCK